VWLINTRMMPQEIDKPFLTQKQTAEVLGISPSTVRNMVRDGVLRRLYKRSMFPTDAVRRLILGKPSTPR
jgi:Mn-dependent DtxR family transcriptional regulator